jgi:hypothetical protein
MPFAIDPARPWTAHFVDYGFAVLKRLVDRELCGELLREVRRLLQDDRPLDEWGSESPGQKYMPLDVATMPLLDSFAGNDRLRQALEEIFGSPTSVVDNFSLWLNPYNPHGRPAFLPLGHIDSGDPDRGISWQVSLVDTEPFSGNTTIFPGTHRLVNEALRVRPELRGKGGAFLEVRRPFSPCEFVAEVGDVLFLHHLTCHSGNPSHAARRSPRVAIRAEAYYKGSERLALSPWQRSLLPPGPSRAPTAGGGGSEGHWSA